MSSGPKVQRSQRKRRPLEVTISLEAHAALMRLAVAQLNSRSAVIEDLILTAEREQGSMAPMLTVAMIAVIQLAAHQDAAEYSAAAKDHPDVERPPPKLAAEQRWRESRSMPLFEAHRGTVERDGEHWQKCYVDAFVAAVANPPKTLPVPVVSHARMSSPKEPETKAGKPDAGKGDESEPGDGEPATGEAEGSQEPEAGDPSPADGPAPTGGH